MYSEIGEFSSYVLISAFVSVNQYSEVSQAFHNLFDVGCCEVMLNLYWHPQHTVSYLTPFKTSGQNVIMAQTKKQVVEGFRPTRI
jgi:hypothetical protein